MACREGNNSVIVSLAYFLTKSDGRNSRNDDALVKRAFHALRIEHAAAEPTGAQIAATNLSLPPDERRAMLLLGHNHPPANPADVLAFLNEQRAVVRNDARIPDRKRAILLTRLDDVETHVTTGDDIPTTVIFKAWKGLRTRTEDMRQAGLSTLPVTTTAGETVTREDVDAAVTAWQTAHTQLQALYSADRSHGLIGTVEQQIEAAKTRVITAEAELHLRVLAYDTTDQGFRELLSQSEALNTYIPLSLMERHRIARDERHRILGITDEALHEQADTFRTIEREYMRARSVGDQEAITRLASQFDQARFNYTRAILLTEPLRPIMENQDAWENSPAIWGQMTDPRHPNSPTRREQWIAIETYASMRDARLAATGSLTEQDAIHRANRRHKCRQTLLTSEKAAS